MAILGNIRKTGNTFVVAVISFLVIMFLGSELVRFLPYIFGNKDEIGRLFGKKISYLDYYQFYQNISHNYASQGKQLSQKDQINAKNYAWRSLTEHMLYAKEIEKLSILVGPQELIDMVQGDHIDEYIIHCFKDPETAQFDKQKLLTHLNKMISTDQQKAWHAFEKQLALKRAKAKLCQLMAKSSFVTPLEAQHAQEQSGLFCNVDYLHIPFTTIKDDLVSLTNGQLLDYMAAHKARYTSLSETRTIKYIVFPVEPDEKDKADFQNTLNELLGQFATTTDPYTFAKEHTHGSAENTKLVCTADTLPAAFTAIKQTLKEGMVVGPVVNEQVHILYKLIKQVEGNYEIAVIEKKSTASDYTRTKALQQGEAFARQLKKMSDFQALATTQHLSVYEEKLSPSDYSIGSYASGRNIVRWLYNEASVGKVSPLFDVGDAYLLALMVDQVKVGDLVPLHSVFSQVHQKVLEQEKSKIILAKLKEIDGTNLQAMAEQYGEGVTVKSAQRLRFLKNDDPCLKYAKTFIGKCFGLKINLISDPIVDEQGVFIASVKSRDIESTESTESKLDQHASQLEQWMQFHYVLMAMEELAKVSDKRYKIE